MSCYRFGSSRTLRRGEQSLYNRISEEFEDPVEALLRDHVDSYEKLEAVLFLRERRGPTPLGEIANALHLSQADTRRAVAALCASGLLVQHLDDHVSEVPDDRIRMHLDALVRAYRADALSIGSKLCKQALARLRQSATFTCYVARSRRGRAR